MQEPELGHGDENPQQALPSSSFQGHELFSVDPMLLTEQDPSLNSMLPIEPAVPQSSANQLVDLGLFEQLPSFDLIDAL